MIFFFHFDYYSQFDIISKNNVKISDDENTNKDNNVFVY